MAENRLRNGYSGQTGLLQSRDGACRASMNGPLTAKSLGSGIGGDEAMTAVFPDDAGAPAACGCGAEYDRTV